jgi:hypothetical protein
MGVFRNENAVALLFRDIPQQGKCSRKHKRLPRKGSLLQVIALLLF